MTSCSPVHPLLSPVLFCCSFFGTATQNASFWQGVMVVACLWLSDGKFLAQNPKVYIFSNDELPLKRSFCGKEKIHVLVVSISLHAALSLADALLGSSYGKAFQSAVPRQKHIMGNDQVTCYAHSIHYERFEMIERSSGRWRLYIRTSPFCFVSSALTSFVGSHFSLENEDLCSEEVFLAERCKRCTLPAGVP